jgi:hypothetical protein
MDNLSLSCSESRASLDSYRLSWLRRLKRRKYKMVPYYSSWLMWQGLSMLNKKTNYQRERAELSDNGQSANNQVYKAYCLLSKQQLKTVHWSWLTGSWESSICWKIRVRSWQTNQVYSLHNWLPITPSLTFNQAWDNTARITFEVKSSSLT